MFGEFFTAAGNVASTAMTNNENRQIAERNLQFQRENLDYQKALQKQIFEREDTAVQRRVEDLKAAGLNPALAHGSAAGAGTPITTQAQHDDMRYQAPHFGNLGSILDTVKSIMELRTLKSENEMIEDEANTRSYENLLRKAEAISAMGVDVNGFKPKGTGYVPTTDLNALKMDNGAIVTEPRYQVLRDLDLSRYRLVIIIIPFAPDVKSFRISIIA